MGRIVKSAVLRNGNREVTVEVQIDSGADMTLLALADARRLGFDPCARGRGGVVSGVGGRATGVEFPVDVSIGARHATLISLVPLVKMVGKNRVAVATRERTLIGHDFLQASKARLDYSQPHDGVFSGISGALYDWSVRPSTKAEERSMRKALKCPRRKR